jgi:glyoxylase-like metal-dependent hydrolase (beta-lactamase superfamily II)
VFRTPTVNRRSLLLSGGAAAACGAAAIPITALAQGAPGEARGAIHRSFSVGSHDVFVLSDGYLTVPTSVLAGNVPQAQVQSFLTTYGLGPDRVYFRINVALVRTGNEYVLIDAGAGGTWEPTAGDLADSLEAAGIKPEQIGTVVLTHAHPDHLWGVIDDLDNSLRYPRARYVVAAREFDFWTSVEAARFLGPVEAMAAAARRVFKAIDARTTRIKPGDEVAPGIVAIDTAGHTPGHISLMLTSGSDKLLITADALQNAHIAFAHPDWQSRVDMDGAKAAKNRRLVLDMAATDKLRILCYHIPFPGLGRVERKGSAFTWIADV